MKMLSRQTKFGFIVKSGMVSLLILALPRQVIAAPQAATAVAPSAPHTSYQYWRSGNPKDTQTITQGGIAMIGGLLFSQSLTLLSTPALYVIFSCLAARRKAWSARRRERRLAIARAV